MRDVVKRMQFYSQCWKGYVQLKHHNQPSKPAIIYDDHKNKYQG